MTKDLGPSGLWVCFFRTNRLRTLSEEFWSAIWVFVSTLDMGILSGIELSSLYQTCYIT
jgi:hypothetical protein